MYLRGIFFTFLILLSTYEWTNMLYMFIYYHLNNDKYSWILNTTTSEHYKYSPQYNLEPLSYNNTILFVWVCVCVWTLWWIVGAMCSSWYMLERELPGRCNHVVRTMLSVLTFCTMSHCLATCIKSSARRSCRRNVAPLFSLKQLH